MSGLFAHGPDCAKRILRREIVTGSPSKVMDWETRSNRTPRWASRTVLGVLVFYGRPASGETSLPVLRDLQHHCHRPTCCPFLHGGTAHTTPFQPHPADCGTTCTCSPRAASSRWRTNLIPAQPVEMPGHIVIACRRHDITIAEQPVHRLLAQTRNSAARLHCTTIIRKSGSGQPYSSQKNFSQFTVLSHHCLCRFTSCSAGGVTS